VILQGLSERARRLLSKRLAYRECFCTPGGELTAAGAKVLRDLARYCGAYRTSFRVSPVTRTADPVATAFAEGRRDAFLRLQAMLKLPDEDFLRAIEDDSP
jgi:hypothetical protein